MGDMCKTLVMNGVIVQENGIIRNAKGYLIGRLVAEIDFESEHLLVKPLEDTIDKDDKC